MAVLALALYIFSTFSAELTAEKFYTFRQLFKYLFNACSGDSNFNKNYTSIIYFPS